MLRTFTVFLFSAFMLSACKPNDEPPPDILKSQREVLDKAKALQGQMQQDLQRRMQQADEDQSK